MLLWQYYHALHFPLYTFQFSLLQMTWKMQETDENLLYKSHSEYTVLTLIQQQYNVLRNK
jgi:hypothetical protein